MLECTCHSGTSHSLRLEHKAQQRTPWLVSLVMQGLSGCRIFFPSEYTGECIISLREIVEYNTNTHTHTPAFLGYIHATDNDQYDLREQLRAYFCRCCRKPCKGSEHRQGTIGVLPQLDAAVSPHWMVFHWTLHNCSAENFAWHIFHLHAKGGFFPSFFFWLASAACSKGVCCIVHHAAVFFSLTLIPTAIDRRRHRLWGAVRARHKASRPT